MRVCSDCLRVIDGAAIVSEGKYFHPEHFCCERCKQPVRSGFHKYKKWRLCAGCLPRPVCSSNHCSEPDRRIGYASGQFYRLPANNRLAAFHSCHTVRCGVCGRGLFCCSGPADALAYHLNEGRLSCTRCYYNIDGFKQWTRKPPPERSETRSILRLDKLTRSGRPDPLGDLRDLFKLAAERERIRRNSVKKRSIVQRAKLRASLEKSNQWTPSNLFRLKPPPALWHGPPPVVLPYQSDEPAASSRVGVPSLSVPSKSMVRPSELAYQAWSPNKLFSKFAQPPATLWHGPPPVVLPTSAPASSQTLSLPFQSDEPAFVGKAGVPSSPAQSAWAPQSIEPAAQPDELASQRGRQSTGTLNDMLEQPGSSPMLLPQSNGWQQLDRVSVGSIMFEKRPRGNVPDPTWPPPELPPESAKELSTEAWPKGRRDSGKSSRVGEQ